MSDLIETTENTINTINNIKSEDYKAKALEYLSSMGNKLPTKQQAQFIEMAQAFGLNPFKRELYAVGYGDNWNIITGYEVYLKRAERIGKLDGWKVTTEGSGDNMTATVTIYRKDWKMPFEHTVLFSEVANKTKEGKLNSVWAKMPSFMCKKVAIAQAFRLCFPDEFGGMPYTSDEISTAEESTEKNITPEEKPAPKPINPLMDKLGHLLNDSVYPNGEAVFTEADKLEAKKSVKAKGLEITIQEVTEALKSRLTSIE